MKKILRVLFLMIISVMTVSTILILNNNQQVLGQASNDIIYEGISINGIDVGGLTREEAYDKLEEYLKDLENETLIITHEDKSRTITLKEIEFRPLNKEVVEEAFLIGKKGNLIVRYKEIKDVEINKINLELDFEYNHELVAQFVEALAQEVVIQPKDAVIRRENQVFVIDKEVQGLDVDRAKTLEAIDNHLRQKEAAGSIQVVVIPLAPQYTETYYSSIQDMIGSFATGYSGNGARTENLRVASGKINGRIVHPGEVFSTHDAIAPITRANGYKEAGVYVAGKVDTGIGGGVCQISTTLYNAIIFSELEIVERQGHSMTVAYVPKGRDAAIAGTYKDFKFRNDTEHPIYIQSYVSNGKVHMNIFGKEIHVADRKIEFETVVTSTITPPPEKIEEDSSLPIGKRIVTQEARNGYKVKVYKMVYENGALVSKDLFSNTSYIAAPAYITVGTKQVSEITPVEPETEIEETSNPIEESVIPPDLETIDSYND